MSERQKQILLANKFDFGWSLIREYKRNDLVEDSDDENKIIRVEARAGQTKLTGSRPTNNRREHSVSKTLEGTVS